MPVAAALKSMVASAYVRDIGTSRTFYQQLGFREDLAGKADRAAWSYLSSQGHFILLASTRPPLDIPRLPLLFYFYFTDLDAVVTTLRDAGIHAAHMGHPPHAQGGEVKLLDPDGNTILIGQRERSAAQAAAATQDEPSSHFSLLKEAAALVAARGGTTATCQIVSTAGYSCPAAAEVKLADAGGDAVWACLAHAEEVLLAVPGAFIANREDGQGIATFRSQRSV